MKNNGTKQMIINYIHFAQWESSEPFKYNTTLEINMMYAIKMAENVVSNIFKNIKCEGESWKPPN